MQKTFAIISGMDEHRGIGKDNGLPWHISADLKHFAEVTKNGTVIMGRKTWESLPEKFRPLKNRLNIVISRGDYEMPEGVLLAHSLDEALTFAGNINPVEKAFVIGGASLYAEAILHPLCTELFLTEVAGVFDCDAFFPEIPDDFNKTEEGEELTEENIKFRFTRYAKS
ncbi:MAG: dihydrofolate reductase [Candidatus Gracilibacteria bacterium]|jgi:dihydrofolate reductase